MNAAEKRGHRLHRLLINELSSAGCFRPAPLRTAAYGAFVLTGYACAYATLLTAPSWGIRLLAIAALAFLCVHAGFITGQVISVSGGLTMAG